MKSRIYVENDKIKDVEMDVSILEYLVIQEALGVFFQNADASASDRYIAVSILDDWSDNREIIEIDSLD